MREMWPRPPAIYGPGHGRQVAADHGMVTLLRRHRGFCIGHVGPEAAVAGPDRLIRTATSSASMRERHGWRVRFSARDRTGGRRQRWTPRRHDYQSGGAVRYAQTVGDAEKAPSTIRVAAETHVFSPTSEGGSTMDPRSHRLGLSPAPVSAGAPLTPRRRDLAARLSTRSRRSTSKPKAAWKRWVLNKYKAESRPGEKLVDTVTRLTRRTRRNDDRGTEAAGQGGADEGAGRHS